VAPFKRVDSALSQVDPMGTAGSGTLRWNARDTLPCLLPFLKLRRFN